MDMVLKNVLAAIRPAEDVSEKEAPHGAFDVILSTPTKDRDGEEVGANEWKMPLPEHITFDADHGMSVATTVGSGRPELQPDGTLRVRGTYASIPRAQEVRALVNEGHIRTVSVAFMRHTKAGEKGGQRIERELLNGAFVAIPANPEAVVLSSKTFDPVAAAQAGLGYALGTYGVKVGARNSAADAKMIQAIHDAAGALGANCGGDPSMGDGPTAGTGSKAVSDAAWNGDPARYSPQQWRHACLIDTGQGDPDSKDRYKLPVREPDGTLNRNAVHAAAAALAGGRGGVQAPEAEKASAARALVAAYQQLGETPPDSITSLAGKGLGRKDADPDADPGQLALAVDAALDRAMPLFASMDISALPVPVQQAIGLVHAADAAIDQLLRVLGVPDPDATDSGDDTTDDDETAVAVLHLRALRARTS